MFERILVPLDGTTLSEQALPHAASIARASGARLHLTMVRQFPSPLFPDTPVQASLGDIEAEYLERVVRSLTEAGVADVRAEVLDGPGVSEALSAHAKDVGAQLVVMSSHGRGPVRRAWLGSVADRLIRESEVPVLLVRAHENGDPAVDLSADVAYRRVMIPIDGSERSEDALEPARSLGRQDGADYLLLRLAASPGPLGSPWFPTTPLPTEEQVRSAGDAARRGLEAVAERLRSDGLEARTCFRSVDHVAEGVLDEARESDVDLIAMATRGRSGVRRMALGSVCDKVLRGAQQPVLVVPPQA